MQPRIDYHAIAPEAAQPLRSLEKYLSRTGLPHELLELMRLRASQINGCAYCVEMHARELRTAGETAARIDLVAVWRESPCYTQRERAALAWTEAVTLLSVDHVPDEVYEAAREVFDERELVDLTMNVIAINAWNRLAVPFRKQIEGLTAPEETTMGVQA